MTQNCELKEILSPVSCFLSEYAVTATEVKLDPRAQEGSKPRAENNCLIVHHSGRQVQPMLSLPVAISLLCSS